MKRFDSAALQKGDVLLTTSPDIVSTLVRKVTGGKVSHAMICVAPGSAIDATLEGVHARNIEKLVYPEQCAIYALRAKRALNGWQIDSVIQRVRSQVGQVYSIGQAALSVVKPAIPLSDAQFCSRLVATAFDLCGVHLVENPSYCTPADILASPQLALVPDAVVDASDNYLSSVNELDDSVAVFRRVSNDYRSRLSKLNGKLRTDEDAIEFACRSSDADSAVADSLIDSDYLNFYAVEIDRFPWRYDIDEMSHLCTQHEDVRPAIAQYCQRTLADEASGTFNHWRSSGAVLAAAFKQRPDVRTLQLYDELYRNLCTLAEAKVEVATAWISGQANFARRAP